MKRWCRATYVDHYCLCFERCIKRYHFSFMTVYIYQAAAVWHEILLQRIFAFFALRHTIIWIFIKHLADRHPCHFIVGNWLVSCGGKGSSLQPSKTNVDRQTEEKNLALQRQTARTSARLDYKWRKHLMNLTCALVWSITFFSFSSLETLTLSSVLFAAALFCMFWRVCVCWNTLRRSHPDSSLHLHCCV